MERQALNVLRCVTAQQFQQHAAHRRIHVFESVAAVEAQHAVGDRPECGLQALLRTLQLPLRIGELGDVAEQQDCAAAARLALRVVTGTHLQLVRDPGDLYRAYRRCARREHRADGVAQPGDLGPPGQRIQAFTGPQFIDAEQQLARRSATAPYPRSLVHHDQRCGDTVEHVLQIGIERDQRFGFAVQLAVEAQQRFVGRAQLLVRGLQPLVGGLEVVVGRQQILVGRLQLLVCGFQFLDDCMQV